MLFLDGPCEGFPTSHPAKVKDYWFIRSLDDLNLLGTLGFLVSVKDFANLSQGVHSDSGYQPTRHGLLEQHDQVAVHDFTGNSYVERGHALIQSPSVLFPPMPPTQKSQPIPSPGSNPGVRGSGNGPQI